MIDVWDRAVCRRIGVVSCVCVLLLLLLLLEMAARYVLEGEDRSNVGWHFHPEVFCQVLLEFRIVHVRGSFDRLIEARNLSFSAQGLLILIPTNRCRRMLKTLEEFGLDEIEGRNLENERQKKDRLKVTGNNTAVI